jgi:N-glycosylase/DNA lyase
LITVQREHSVEQLQELYKDRRSDIRKRLEDFRQVLDSSDEEVFGELSFCLLTPQSSAKVCWDAVLKMKEANVLLSGTAKEIEPYVKQVRFGDSKARYIVEARKTFRDNGKLQLKSRIRSFYNPYELREWLVENVKGLGYKEASHFMRNIGLGEELAILDRHILRNLAELKVIPEVPATITKKRYLEMEEKLRTFSKKIDIPMGELDLLFWSKETGWIFK